MQRRCRQQLVHHDKSARENLQYIQHNQHKSHRAIFREGGRDDRANAHRQPHLRPQQQTIKEKTQHSWHKLKQIMHAGICRYIWHTTCSSNEQAPAKDFTFSHDQLTTQNITSSRHNFATTALHMNASPRMHFECVQLIFSSVCSSQIFTSH